MGDLKIEAGRFYRTRGGEKAGPISEYIGPLRGYVWSAPLASGVMHSWVRSGCWDWDGVDHEFDLVAEWIDDTPAPTPDPAAEIARLRGLLDQAREQIASARAFVAMHPSLGERDRAEFEAFLRVPAALTVLAAIDAEQGGGDEPAA